ncbi:MAG: hypothetical protein RL518_397 [Pseudomonadota bacterium]
MKPSELASITILMAIFNVCGVVFLDQNSANFAMESVVVGLLVSVTFVILYFFWLGRNWARILVLLTSVLALLNLIVIANSTLSQQIVIALEALLAIYLIYWLNTPRIKDFFVKRSPR